MAEKKYLPIGNVVSNKDLGDIKNWDDIRTIADLFEALEISVTLDNVKLAELAEFIEEHGEKYLAGLTDGEIMEGQKKKYTDESHIPRPRGYFFAPHEKAPDFIKANLAIKVK